ncbi:ubiquinol-cytochrome c reductase cytochrome c1 subunit [Sulfuricella denitrificans skB26]|uniref:Ubiquinol-cytochrome c reductase cytochrome c1 subunit n=1 Tax=Sulfuricella denitrificans (strain DSM 22764 / NBRC 105220 / skB26) TaxID=1163617 RepID=S6A9P1_SULDS|nr:cytochrome c1 [Sulfuricella denitrificans]BAN34450.1 ubiquinol-cytochrome c reductase cytochrome c1 subunit [Sulfuricella denitrificans skB26]
MKKILFLVSLLASTMAFASSDLHLDKAPTNLSDQQSLQRGAKTFVNYCLSCHSAQAMRYNRLQDIGLTEQQIKDNLIFTDAKVGDTMTNNMSKKDAKVWFGAPPPDLSVIARFRGVDWLYTYLRGFYRDETRPTGWNNVAFDKVGMPHVLNELQGEQVLHVEKHGEHETHKLMLAKPGKMTPVEYDGMVADLVNYLDYMGEPAKTKRMTLGIYVLLFLAIFFVPAYYLKKEYWKDIH